MSRQLCSLVQQSLMKGVLVTSIYRLATRVFLFYRPEILHKRPVCCYEFRQWEHGHKRRVEDYWIDTSVVRLFFASRRPDRS